MRAAVFHAPGDIRVEDVEEPAAGPEDVVIDVAACGICGSDLESWRSGASVQPGQVMGHEIGGTVRRAPESSGLAPGDIVAVRPLLPCGECRQCARGEIQLCERTLLASIGYGLPGGFASTVVVPRGVAGLSVIPLPAGADAVAAALVEPLAVSLRGVRAAEVAPGDVVVVFGLGQIGLGAVALSAHAGASCIVAVDPSARRRSAAKALGAHVVVDPMSEDVAGQVREVTGPGAYGLGAAADAAIDASGIPSSFTSAVKSLRPGGRLSLIAHSKEPFAVKSGRIVEKELTIRGSFGYRHEMPEVAELLATGALDHTAFVSHEFPLSEVHQAFEAQADAATSLKVLMKP